MRNTDSKKGGLIGSPFFVQVLLDLLKMKQTHLVDLDYALVAARRDDGSISINNSNVLVRADTTAGCQWGIIFGRLAGLILGGIVGAAAGETRMLSGTLNLKKQDLSYEPIG